MRAVLITLSNIHQTSEVTTEGVITQWDQSHPYGVNPVYA